MNKNDLTNRKSGCFLNPHLRCSRRRLIDFLLWQLGYFNDRNKLKRVPKNFTYPNPKTKLDANQPSIVWINHSSFLIEIDHIRLLTDPIWSERCSPFSFLGPKRRHPPPFPLEELPPIHMILISHDHYDHFDRASIKRLKVLHPKATWIVPKGVKKRLKKYDISKVVELGWWESTNNQYKKGGLKIKTTAVPTQHFSGRGLFDKNRSLWAGYVLEFQRRKKKNKRLYFVGDTGYNLRDFKRIGKTFGSMDLSLIPIGTYVPRRFMTPMHIDPQKAVRIHREVRSSLSIGMHWKTFRLSDEALNQPPYDLLLTLKKKRLDPKTFRVIDPGQTINW